jgi:hypothetical protein
VAHALVRAAAPVLGTPAYLQTANRCRSPPPGPALRRRYAKPLMYREDPEIRQSPASSNASIQSCRRSYRSRNACAKDAVSRFPFQCAVLAKLRVPACAENRPVRVGITDCNLEAQRSLFNLQVHVVPNPRAAFNPVSKVPPGAEPENLIAQEESVAGLLNLLLARWVSSFQENRH